MAKLKPMGKAQTTDINIAAGMLTIALVSEQGIQSLVQVIQGATDPAAALAHAVFLAMGKVRIALTSKHIAIDPKVWIAGGGVLDQVLFKVLGALATIGKIQMAADPKFVHQVKADILDLMQDDDDNSEAIKTLHQKGLPIPQQGQQQPPQGGPPQGLAAPQPGAQ